MLVVAHINQELIICTRYYQLLEQKNFLRLCRHYVWFILCWLNYRMPKELTVFGVCIWKMAWKMIKTTFRFLSHQEIEIPVTSHQSVSLQCHHHHQVIMWPSLLKLANCSATLFYSLLNGHCHFLSKLTCNAMIPHLFSYIDLLQCSS